MAHFSSLLGGGRWQKGVCRTQGNSVPRKLVAETLSWLSPAPHIPTLFLPFAHPPLHSLFSGFIWAVCLLAVCSEAGLCLLSHYSFHITWDIFSSSSGFLGEFQVGEATWAVKANTSLTREPCPGNLFIFSAAFPRAQPRSPGLTLSLSPWASGEQGKQTGCEFFRI